MGAFTPTVCFSLIQTRVEMLTFFFHLCSFRFRLANHKERNPCKQAVLKGSLLFLDVSTFRRGCEVTAVFWPAVAIHVFIRRKGAFWWIYLIICQTVHKTLPAFISVHKCRNTIPGHSGFTPNEITINRWKLSSQSLSKSIIAMLQGLT